MAGGKGLTWAEITKRYYQCFEVIYNRIKNDKPFILLDNNRLSEDNGVEVYFKMVGISIPTQENGRWKQSKEFIEFEPKRFASFENFYSGKNGILQSVERAIRQNSNGIARAPFRVNFYTTTSKSISSTINSGKILKDNGLGMDIGFGGKASRGGPGLFWGKLQYYVDNVDSTYSLNRPSSTEQGEADFINAFNGDLDKLEVPMIDLQIGTKTFSNIVGVNKVEGKVKADLAFVALENRKLIDVAWFSHKQGFRANHFQQWGGVSHYANDTEGADETLDKFPEIRAFANYLSYFCGTGMQYDFKQPSGKGFTAMMDIQDNALKMESVYGKNFGNSQYGVSNCTGVLQGNPSIRKVGSKYQLHMSAHLIMNPTPMTGDYEPVLMLINKGDRTQYGITGARVVVQPRASRTAKFIVSKDSNGNYQMRQA